MKINIWWFIRLFPPFIAIKHIAGYRGYRGFLKEKSYNILDRVGNSMTLFNL